MRVNRHTGELGGATIHDENLPPQPSTHLAFKGREAAEAHLTMEAHRLTDTVGKPRKQPLGLGIIQATCGKLNGCVSMGEMAEL